MSLMDDIMAGNNTELLPVNIPELKVKVYVKRLKYREMLEIAQKEYSNDTLLYLAHVLCDDQGNPIFVDDVDKLQELAYSLIIKLVKIANEFNNVEKED